MRKPFAEKRLRKIKDLRLFPVVEVEWLDAVSDRSSWENPDTAIQETVPHCRSVGRMIQNTSKLVRLITTINSDGGVGGQWVIPKSWVVKIQKVGR